MVIFLCRLFMYPLKTSLFLIAHGNVYSSANSLNRSSSKRPAYNCYIRKPGHTSVQQPYCLQKCQSNMSVISVSQSVSQSLILDPYKTQDSISLLMNKHFQGLFIKGRKAWGGYTDIIIRSYLFLVL